MQDQGWRILECVHRHRPQEGAQRPALPGQWYVPPPAQEGWPPDSLTELRLRLLLEQTPPDAPLWRALVDGLLGVSPLLARELVFRATGDARTQVGQVTRLTSLLEAAADLIDPLQTGTWQPCLTIDTRGKPAAFAPYPLTHRTGDGLETLPGISLAAERYYADRASAGDDAYAAARRQVAATVERVQRGLQRRRDAISRELRSPEEVERWRVSGEWILALSSTIGPRQAELVLPEETGIPPVALDPALSPADNAARYFKRYRKARRAQKHAGPRLAEVEAELAYVEQLAADLALAADRSEIDAVRAQLADAGYLRQSTTRAVSQPKGPRRYTSREGFAILVGRNSRQNERVTFEIATADDLWLHARGFPGSHVVIRSGGRPVSDETVQRAAELAAYSHAAAARRR
ncbi:MAG: NFACT RNA binding domain-containing protein [Caldilineales bacterium]